VSGLWIFAIWLVGLAGAGTLNAAADSASERVRRVGRVAYAGVIAIDLLFVALIYAATSPATLHSLWWVIALACGVPIAAVTGVAVKPAYAGGYRVVLIAAVVTTAVLYLAFPLGFVPSGQELTGLGRFEHAHHRLDVVLLLIPALIVLAGEMLRGRVDEEDDPTFLTRLRNAPRGAVVGSALALVAFIWLLGAKPAAMLISIAVLAVSFLLFAWWQTRAAVRRVRRDLE
jgi:hypothetical protein